MTETADPVVDAVVGRILPIVSDLKRIDAQADDMFCAFLGVPAQSIPGVARILSEALGHVVYEIAKAVAMERGFSFTQQVAVQHQVFMHIYRQLPAPNGEVESADEMLRLTSRYNRPAAASKREWNRFVGSYVADLERLFQHRLGTEVRRAARLVLDTLLPQTVTRTLQALEGPDA